MKVGDQRFVQQIERDPQQCVDPEAFAQGDNEKDKERCEKDALFPTEQKDTHR
jgi:hypothetical protein